MRVQGILLIYIKKEKDRSILYRQCKGHRLHIYGLTHNIAHVFHGNAILGHFFQYILLIPAADDVYFVIYLAQGVIFLYGAHHFKSIHPRHIGIQQQLGDIIIGA